MKKKRYLILIWILTILLPVSPILADYTPRLVEPTVEDTRSMVPAEAMAAQEKSVEAVASSKDELPVIEETFEDARSNEDANGQTNEHSNVIKLGQTKQEDVSAEGFVDKADGFDEDKDDEHRGDESQTELADVIAGEAASDERYSEEEDATKEELNVTLVDEEQDDPLSGEGEASKRQEANWEDHAKVTGLKARTLAKGARIELSWDATPGASGYAVYRQQLGQVGISYMGSVLNTTFVDAKFQQAGLHFYWILPFKYVNDQPVFSSISDTYAWGSARPQPAKNLTLEAKGKRNALTWDESPGASYYYVFRQTGNETGFSYLTFVRGTSYTDAQAPVGITIYRIYPVFKYRSITQVGNSLETVYNLRYPDPVNNLKLEGQTLSWSASQGADIYHIYRQTKGQGAFTYLDATTELSYKDPHWTHDAAYQVRPAFVKDKKAYVSSQSEIVGGAYDEPLEQVTNVKVQNQKRWGAKLTWDPVPTASQYVIFRQAPDHKHFFRYRTLGQTSYTEENLYPGTYYYRVYATKRVNGKTIYSEPSKAISLTIAEPSQNKYEKLYDWDSLIQLVRAGIKVRSPELHFNVVYPKATAPQQFQELMDAICQIVSGDSRDQLYWQIPEAAEISGYRYSGEQYDHGDRIEYNIDFTIRYFSTKQQHEQAKQAAHQVADQAETLYNHEVDRLKFGFDWLVNKTDYAYVPGTREPLDRLPNGVSTHTAFSVISNQQTVCQGYTSFLAQIYTRLGTPIFIASSDVDNHMWMLAQVGNNWYHLDPTHADRTADGLGVDYDFFLRSAKNMSEYPLHTMYTHFPAAPYDYYR